MSQLSPSEAALARADGGDVDGAVAALREQIGSDAEDDDAYLVLGMILAKAGRWGEALPVLAEAVDRDADAAIGRVLYARALDHAGKVDDAVFQMLRAARLDEANAGVLRELGSLFYKKGLHEKAIQWLQKARGAARGDAVEEARALYAVGLVQEARRDPGAAVAAYRDAIRLDPKHVDARKTLADVLAGMGEHGQAIQVLDELLRVDRTNEQAARNREILERALREMHAQRLLGKTAKELEQSALVQAGHMKRRGRTLFGLGRKEDVREARYANDLAELHVTFGDDRTITELYLVLPDPGKASSKRDTSYEVTVVAKDGGREPASFATAASLTFLREALGVPLTQAGGLYARLLAGEAAIVVSGLEARFAARDRPDGGSGEERELHGLLVRTVGRAGPSGAGDTRPKSSMDV